jgi:hypothetical protein
MWPFLFFLLFGLKPSHAQGEELKQDLDINTTKEWCFYQKRKYNIVPGQSFGNLPKSMHQKYLNTHCDQYFCKPNHGKGVFRCEPLDNNDGSSS